MLKNRKFQAVIFASFLFFGMSKDEPTELESILERGTLRVASRLGPLTYYEREGEPSGMDYNLLTALATHLGVELEIQLYDNIDEQLQSVYSDEIDMAASTLTITPARQQTYDFSEPYTKASVVLVQHSSEGPKDSITEILDKDYRLTAIENSSHAEILNELQNSHPSLYWVEDPELIMFQLMEMVQTREIDYTLVDSSIYEMERSMFPRVEIGLQLTEPQPIGFVFARGSDQTLINAVDEFLLDYQASGEMKLLEEAYFQDHGRMDVAGSLLFKERLEQRLPEFEPLFRQVAEEHDYDWLLLAAQAYQESHWDERARSPTGVRGLMMLTLPTARQLGVTNRLDAEQSLRGGLEYLLSLHKRMPERIPEPDRKKFALAAYNVGFGHLEDARILTERGGDNPDLWDDVEKYLPLLRQKKYYSTVKRGYARGNEPVSYVNNIYRFKSILDWYTWQRELELENMFVEPEQEPEEMPFENILDLPLSPI